MIASRAPSSGRHVVLVRMVHRTGVESGDLVVVQVGSDERLRGELPRYPGKQPPECRVPKPLQVRLDVLPDGRHDQRLFAKELQVVADIPRRATELAAHLGCQEAHVQDVQLIGEEMMAEAIGEHHDSVVGDRSGDENTHAG